MKFMIYALCGLLLFIIGCSVLLLMVIGRDGFGPGMMDFEFELTHGWKLIRTSGDEITVNCPRLGGASKIYSENGTLLSNPAGIPPKVVKIAWDKRFIIAKQYNLKRKWPGKPIRKRTDKTNYNVEVPDKTKANYWIIDASIDKVYGPFNTSDFKKQKTALGVPGKLILKSIDYYEMMRLFNKYFIN